MVEQNPLQVIPSVNNTSYVIITNKKGRPRKGHGTITFGPQPQSMVAKYFELKKPKVKANCSNFSNSPEKHDNDKLKSISCICESEKNTVLYEDKVNQNKIKIEHTILKVPSESSCINQNGSTNRKGRPQKGSTICFGPQPQSIMANILSKIRTEKSSEKCNDIETISIPSIPLIEAEQDPMEDNYDHSEEPKRKEIKEPAKPKSYACDFENCSYTAKLASNLIKHKRVHTNEKPYLCDQCSFRSNFINSLKCHKRLHTEVRPYKCNECSYICNSISNLKKHCYSRH